MREIKWGFLVLLLAVAGAFLHYYLPSRDIVRVVGTDVKRVDRDFEGNPVAERGTASRTWDVRYINTAWPDGDPRVYRNEDTGWSWPPYLKFDSGNLQAQAQARISTAADPAWMVVTHYGWRIEILSLYPNAIRMRAAKDQNEFLFPWFNTVLLTSLAALVWYVWRFIRRLRRRHLDPVIDKVSDEANRFADAAAESSDDVRDRTSGLWRRLRRWIDSWRAKDKRRFD